MASVICIPAQGATEVEGRGRPTAAFAPLALARADLQIWMSSPAPSRLVRGRRGLGAVIQLVGIMGAHHTGPSQDPMPHYLFRRDIVQPQDAQQRSLMDNLARAMREVGRSNSGLDYDLAGAHVEIDGGGERIEMKVGEVAHIGWHLEQAQTLAKYGIRVTRFKGA